MNVSHICNYDFKFFMSNQLCNNRLPHSSERLAIRFGMVTAWQCSEVTIMLQRFILLLPTF